MPRQTCGVEFVIAAIKDGYAALKALIIRKSGAAQPKAESTLTDYVGDLDTYENRPPRFCGMPASTGTRRCSSAPPSC